jgi:hypothetical protein
MQIFVQIVKHVLENVNDKTLLKDIFTLVLKSLTRAHGIDREPYIV